MISTARTEPMCHLDHEEVMRTVKRIPPLEPSVVQLNELFSDSDYEFTDVIRAIELDPALSGKLLHIANTASRGQGRVGSLREAVISLGPGVVKSVAMAQCVRPQANLDLTAFRLTPELYWRHSVTVVCFAEELAVRKVADFGNDFSVAACCMIWERLCSQPISRQIIFPFRTTPTWASWPQIWSAWS